MRRYEKKLYLELLDTLNGAHAEILKHISRNEYEKAKDLLAECQKAAVEIGNAVEKSEGEGAEPVKHLENYCEFLYQVHEFLSEGQELNQHSIEKNMQKLTNSVHNSINAFVTKLEIVFIPYKASMWDSLESIYLAFKKREDCDAYCIPIPYVEKNPDGTVKELNYEGGMFPKDIEVISYLEYDMQTRHPDIIFFHNPYDQYNYVTSVHPDYYSDRLREYTDRLVYVPYFATAGGMGDAQSLFPSYMYADYIVVQSEKFRGFYDPQIPAEKFLPYGSPKFDRVIRLCGNPPEPPEEWKEKLKRGKVYFYNTSINGMLDDTVTFLKKMRYVFDTFKGREDCCLLWRPHPLFESTFDSMRPEYKQDYEDLKHYFFDEDIGIFDTTPDIETTIALCDAYIGDAASSVVSLFGVVGKPTFILNNRLYSLPEEDDWKAWVYYFPQPDKNDRYCLTQGNKLYYSPDNDFNYHYFCDLSDKYSGGGYYSTVKEVDGGAYVFPQNAQNILAISVDGKRRVIPLKQEIVTGGAFHGVGNLLTLSDYIFLYPNRYPALVRFNVKTERCDYVPGVGEYNIAVVDGERISCARWYWRGKYYFLNAEGTEAMAIDIHTLEISYIPLKVNQISNSVAGEDWDVDVLWFLPYKGTKIVRWNTRTDEWKTVDLMVDGLCSTRRPQRIKCDLLYFGSVAFTGERIIFSPLWGNKFVSIDYNGDDVREWQPPFPYTTEDDGPYWTNGAIGWFIKDISRTRNVEKPDYRFCYLPKCKTYDIDFFNNTYKEVEISFDKEEVFSHVAGFASDSEWLAYCLIEDVYNTLTDFINGDIHGNQYDKHRQLQAYLPVNASPAGDCGEKVAERILQDFI